MYVIVKSETKHATHELCWFTEDPDAIFMFENIGYSIDPIDRFDSLWDLLNEYNLRVVHLSKTRYFAYTVCETRD